MKSRPLFRNLIGITLLALSALSSARSQTRQDPSGRGPGPAILVPAQGVLYFVNTTSDTVVAGACANGQANCSLRGAIQAANSHPGEDGIDISLPTGSIINLSAALPDITESVSIAGPGPNLVTVRRNTAGTYRIFNVTAGPTSISGLTISNGVATTGGGINKTSSALTITNCVFLGNVAQNGGGIYNGGGTLNVTNCAFTNNGADATGGGIANDFFGTLNVIGSTFTGNIANNGNPSASGGAAIGNGNLNSSSGGFANVTNCTITGNTAIQGGGISTVAAFAGGALTVTNSTIVRNFSSGSNGGGISSDSSGPVNIKNTMVALSTGTRDVNGIFVSSGFNLIGKVDGSTGFTAPTDQTGTIAAPLDPKIDPAGLQNNGGPTQTIVLQSGSPAIDKGTSGGLTGNLTTDQRGSGFPRTIDYPVAPNAPGGDGADIGAVEFGGSLVPISVSRKMHGAAIFDMDLPQIATAGVECRTGGAANNHQAIVNFPGPVTVTNASVTTGTGSVSNFVVNGSQVTVNLAAVANAQTIALTLFGVSNGTIIGNVSVPMGLLLGDTNGNGTVNATDVGQAKAQSGQPVTAANFRNDVNVNGSINATDIGQVKTQSGAALP
ncbi:MAG: choice-of-anchor Q domain-containing protein [Chthoniobacterales bacterium]